MGQETHINAHVKHVNILYQIVIEHKTKWWCAAFVFYVIIIINIFTYSVSISLKNVGWVIFKNWC